MTTTATPVAATPTDTSTASLVRTGIAAAVVASCATTTVAAAGNAVGISLDMAGQPIPVLGFGTLTAMFSVVGLILAAVLSRTARHPRGRPHAAPGQQALLTGYTT